MRRAELAAGVERNCKVGLQLDCAIEVSPRAYRILGPESENTAVVPREGFLGLQVDRGTVVAQRARQLPERLSYRAPGVERFGPVWCRANGHLKVLERAGSLRRLTGRVLRSLLLGERMEDLRETRRALVAKVEQAVDRHIPEDMERLFPRPSASPPQ